MDRRKFCKLVAVTAPMALMMVAVEAYAGSSKPRYKGNVCRLCRREGMKLFLRGERCYGTKCEIERRGYNPGQHGTK